MNARSKLFTLTFYVAFALWFTATRYSGPIFYSWLLAPSVQDVLGVAVFSVFLIVAALVVRRSIRTAAFPWMDIAVVAGAIIGLELLWRFCRYLVWDAFKLTSIVLDVATPLIIVMGLIALSLELSLRRSSEQTAM